MILIQFLILLKVLRNCINCIFENKISDARKSFPAVTRALKSKAARLALCTELAQHVVGNKAMLEHQQFDLVVKLMNYALQVCCFHTQSVMLFFKSFKQKEKNNYLFILVFYRMTLLWMNMVLLLHCFLWPLLSVESSALVLFSLRTPAFR